MAEPSLHPWLSTERVHRKMLQWEDHELQTFPTCRLQASCSRIASIWFNKFIDYNYHFTMLKGWPLCWKKSLCITLANLGEFIHILLIFIFLPPAPPMLRSSQLNCTIRWLHRLNKMTYLQNLTKNCPQSLINYIQMQKQAKRNKRQRKKEKMGQRAKNGGNRLQLATCFLKYRRNCNLGFPCCRHRGTIRVFVLGTFAPPVS